MEETQEEKQKFLLENIIEKGYDEEKFTQYLVNKKGQAGIYLDNWKMSELVEIYNEFIQQHQNNNDNNNNNINNNINNKYKNENNSNKINNINEIGNSWEIINKIVENDNFSQYKNSKELNEYTNCKLIENTLISKEKELEIRITNPRRVKEGIFSLAYSLYTIETENLDLKVDRKFSDFEWLHNILTKKYINCIIPPISIKKDKFLEKNLQRRARAFEMFLNSIALHPILRNSKIFYYFISIEIRQEFESMQKSYQKIGIPKSIYDIQTLNSEIKNTISDSIENITTIHNTYFNVKENLNYKLQKNLKILNKDILEVSNKMKDIADNWKEINEHNKKYYAFDSYSGIFEAMNKLMNEWSKYTKEQIYLINNYIREFLKFINMEEKKFIDLFSNIQENKSIYAKSQEKLLAEKEMLFTKNNYNEWSLDPDVLENPELKELIKDKNYAFSKMLPEDTEKVNELKKVYGCYFNIYNEEFERLRKLNIIKSKKYFGKLFIENLKENLTNFHVSLGEILVLLILYQLEIIIIMMKFMIIPRLLFKNFVDLNNRSGIKTR